MAGHPPPVVVHPDGTVHSPDVTPDPPLGAANPPFNTHHCICPTRAFSSCAPTGSSNPPTGRRTKDWRNCDRLRGLQLVATLSRRWGARYHHDGKCIWTEQNLPAPGYRWGSERTSVPASLSASSGACPRLRLASSR
ncbi:SpoIIE family protein phosphatase [Streptomyces europaeiscabiei]|uniref:SpoIIE family protein phosphatase n=1 Tax=Streptomyces europaeiscabiei TaxID=146819 RepID=UPI00399AE813